MTCHPDNIEQARRRRNPVRVRACIYRFNLQLHPRPPKNSSPTLWPSYAVVLSDAFLERARVRPHRLGHSVASPTANQRYGRSGQGFSSNRTASAPTFRHGNPTASTQEGERMLPKERMRKGAIETGSENPGLHRSRCGPEHQNVRRRERADRALPGTLSTSPACGKHQNARKFRSLTRQSAPNEITTERLFAPREGATLFRVGRALGSSTSRPITRGCGTRSVPFARRRLRLLADA